MKHPVFPLAFALAVVSIGRLGLAVTLPHVFGDHMVLQRDRKVPVWGKADPGEKVTVRFAGQAVSAVAGADGKWKLWLEPLVASVTGRDFVVEARERRTFADVLVGEVWFCSGQSNMEYPMCGLPWVPSRRIKDSEREVAAANHPRLRHFNVQHKISPEPLDDVPAVWERTTPETVGPQSAVAYVFGETLMKELDIPVGLINSSWGGTRIEPWIPAGHPDDLWLLQNLQDRNRPRDVTTMLWNGMVAGLVPFSIKGAIWYQGCANRQDGHAYLDKTVALVRGWRREWGQGDFPYFLVQLAPFKYGNPRGEELALVQEAQAEVPKRVPNSGYTVINDVGDVNDIHPTDKRTVGMRLADQVLDRVYGKAVRPWKTPTATGMKIEGTSVRVSFADADGLKTRDGKSPSAFEIRDVSGRWLAAHARIEGTDVVLTAAGTVLPTGMRFAPYNASTPNLVNGAGLPAGPFRFCLQTKLGEAEALPKAAGYTCVQRYDIPVKCDLRKDPPRTLASVAGVRRVAYLLELQHPWGQTRFAFAEMDAYAEKSDEMVLSEKSGRKQVRQKVGNLSVFSNIDIPGVRSGAAEGFLEFYSCNYATAVQPTPSGGDPKRYDFNDTPHPAAELGYGCLQVHDLSTRSTVLAFNHFNNADVPCDVGVGTSLKNHPDWTMSRNAGEYTVRRLSVWVKQ